MSVQQALGYRAVCQGEFFVKLPAGNIYEVDYTISPETIRRGTLLGQLIDLNGEPNLVILRVVELDYCTEEHIALNWPSLIKAIPIFHRGDDRGLSDLPIDKFELRIDDVACLFYKRKL